MFHAACTASRASWAVAAMWLIASTASVELGQVAAPADTPAQSVRALIDAGRFDEAEAAARRLVPGDANTVDQCADLAACDLLVEALLRNGRGAEPATRQLAERLVATRRATGDPTLAIGLRNSGEALFQSGDYRLATQRFREALLVDERSTPASPGAVAEDLDRLVRALTESDQYKEALAFSNRAMVLRQQRADTAGLARTLGARGLLQQKTGSFVEARADLERSLSLLVPLAPDHPDVAMAMTHLGDQFREDGELLRAREVITRAVAIAVARLRPDHPDLAASLRSLGATLQELGDLAGSRDVRERAVAMAERGLGADHVLLAIQLNDLANTLFLQGEYARARVMYERARAIYVRRLGPDFVGAITASFNLALLDVELGDFAEARRGFQRVVSDWRRVLGRNHVNVARACSALAEALSRQGLEADAQRYYQEALAIRERALGPDHIFVARTLSALAGSLARTGQLRRASDLAQRAIGIWERAGGREGLAAALVDDGRIRVKRGDYATAAAEFARALDLRLQLLGPAHPSVAVTEVAYADAEAHLDRRQDAFDRAMRGDAISREHSRLTLGYLSERQALEHAANRPPGLDLALSIFQGGAERMRVYDAVIRGRALTLDEIGSRHRSRLDAGSGALAPLWSALTSARQRLANLVVRGPDEQRPRQYAIVVDEARRDVEQAERELVQQSASFRSQLRTTAIDIERVRAALPADAALVSFVRFTRTLVSAAPAAGSATTPRRQSASAASYIVFVLRPGTAEPVAIPLGRADGVERLISRWRQDLMASVIAETPGSPATAFRALGVELRRKLWDPITPHLAGVSRVFVVPDHAVNLVPLAALPVGGSRYLLEAGPTIHYLSTERDLAAPEREGRIGRGLLAVGGASFSDPSTFAALSTSADGSSRRNRGESYGRPVPAPTNFRGANAPCNGFPSMRFGPLPETRREAEDVRRLWRTIGSGAASDPDLSRVLVGGAASELAIKRAGPGRRVLHLATHGFFLDQDCVAAPVNTRSVGGIASTKPTDAVVAVQVLENPLLLSGLALAGANRRDAAGPGEEDGILTAEEVASLDLEGVEWAVLSACETGLGQVRASEGVFGLRRAFQVAGARTVIMSLWAVEDTSARVWMRALYEGRLKAKFDTATAVRQASLQVLAERRRRKQSTHPFFWAGFVAVGDWK